VAGYTDSDGDGLNDFYEYLARTSPRNVDTDGDGTTDGLEVSPAGGLTNIQKQQIGGNPLLVDTDFDGVSDVAEFGAGTAADNQPRRTASGGAEPGGFGRHGELREAREDGSGDVHGGSVAQPGGAAARSWRRPARRTTR